MATYVPGVGSYLPDFKPFTPDYKFLSNVLETKTQKYETNYKALNDLYGKVVYGNLSRKDTQEMRDQYAENLAPKLQQIAGLDLSMAQNVDTAKALFRPFFEEDLIVKDLVQTKKYRNEMQYADMLKNSTVDTERQKYWQTGVQKMQFEMEDFVEANPEEALKMATPTYTPNANLYEKAIEVLNSSGLETDVVTTISDNGEWMIHRKNGDLITNEALTLVQKTLKDDPMVINAYHADAYVKARTFAQNGVDEGKFANLDQGQNVWATDKIKEIETEIEKRQAALAEKKKLAAQKNEAWNKSNKQDPPIKGSPEEKASNQSKSDLSAVREKLAEIDKLYDDQPQSEKDFKTNGEYNPGNTRSLLNRAYSLMMNMGMETDLQAAAINYSKKGMMSKLEANEYAVLAKRHKYDMAKVAAQHANRLKEAQVKAALDRENIKLKAQLEYEATGQDKLDLEGSESTSENNTVTATNIDKNGKATLNGDHIENQEKVAAGLQNQLTAQEIQWTLEMLRRKQGLTNGGSGMITVDGIGTMSAKEMEQEMSKYLLNDKDNAGFQEMKKKYSVAFEREFKNMGDLLKIEESKVNQETFADNSPLLFDSKDPIKEFANLQNGYDALNRQKMALDANISKLYEVTDYNIKKAVNSQFNLEDGNEFKDLMAKAVNAGMPTMIYKDEDGMYKRHTDASYKDAYFKWIQSGGGQGLSVDDVDVKGFDDTSWIRPSENERSWSDADDRMAYLGERAGVSDEQVYYRGKSPGNPTEIVPLYVREYDGAFSNDRERSDMQAEKFMAAMYELNNFAIKGKLEATQDITTEKGDFAEFGNIFKTYDIKQGMRGISQVDQNPGEISNNPVYEVLVDPLAISDSAAEQLNTLNKQVNEDPSMTIMLSTHGFNDVNKIEESSYWDDNDIIVDKDNGGGNINYTQAKQLYKQYIMDMTKRRTTASKSQGDYPIATIKYFPSWTAKGDNLDHKYAGYTLQFSDEYLEGYRKKGGMLDGVAGNTLSFIIPKSQDKNPRKYGEFNFSYVASSIATSDDHSFQKAVPAGGSFSITENLDQGYNMNYQILQFNGETGEYDSAYFTKQLVNDQGMPIGTSNKQELDFYMRKYLYELQRIGQDNKSQRDAWKKNNPSKTVDSKEDDNFNFMFGAITPEQKSEEG